MNRVYHQTTTKYNALYNANELIKTSMRAYRMIHIDDFDEILPIEALPMDDNQVALYPIMDTVVAKCMKAIAKHSMPSFSRSIKKEEYNKWIDQAWLMTGYAKYYKGDYEGALESFAYVEKFFNDKPAKYTARLWKAKCFIREGNLVKADAMLRELERDADRFQRGQVEKKSERKSKKSKKKKSKNANKKEKPAAVPPNDFAYEYYKVKAELAIIRKKYDDAQRYMEIVVSDIKNSEEAARMHFILAQLAIKNGENPIAVTNYTKTLKKKAPFVLQFTARLQRAIASTGPDKAVLTAELIKMANEAKNIEYRDQIYYALGNIAENDSDIPLAMSFYTKSAYYSISNAKQKGKSYERMGNVKMTARDYVKAQKYFDSCTRVAPQDYKNREVVVRKSNKLRDLVDAIETAQLQDSLLRIAAMSPAEQEAHLEKVKKQLEKDEKERLERERVRAAELEAMRQNSQQTQGGSGNRWYFYNPRTRADGYEEFKRFWGQRELEDDWRRSNKIPSTMNMEIFDDPELDSLLSTTPTKPVDKFSMESLRGNIPQTDEEIELAQQILVEALYRSGRIYNEELSERDLAIKQFEQVMTYRIDDKHVLLSAFELYRLYDGVNPNQRAFYAEYIMTNYPNSDYAKYIQDPNYFVKKKERERLDLEDYEKQIERFRNGQYSAVRARTRSILQNDQNNAYLSGYMLLNALCEAALMSEKKGAIPFFEAVIDSYPGSKEAKRAETMIDIINKGFSKWEEVNFGSNASEFDYKSGKMFFVLVANRGDKVSELKKDLSNFNSEFFSSDRLSTKETIIGTDIDVIRVSSFKNESDAKKYRNAFKTAKRTIKHLQAHTFFIITEENFVKLIGSGNMTGYLKFYAEFY